MRVYREMPDAEYFAVGGMSASIIKAGAKSMLQMKHAITRDTPPTQAMITGTQMHMAILEPWRFGKLHQFDGTRATKEYKAMVAEHGEENMIKSSEFEECMLAAEVVKNHPVVKARGLIADGVAEAPLFWDEAQGHAKAKIDYLKSDCFIEYKTTQNISKFMYTARALRYDLQLGWYWRATERPGVIIVQEQSAPYDVAVYEPLEFSYQNWFDQCVAIWDKWLSGDRSGAYSEPVLFEVCDGSDNLILAEE